MELGTPSSWEQLDWPSLLDAARTGLDGAMAEVFQRLSSYSCMIAGSRLPSDIAPKLGASDIAQKSLLEAFTRFESFNGDSEAEIRSWLTTIIQHNVIDAARHFRDAQRRSHKRELSLHEDKNVAEPAGNFPPPSFALRRHEEDIALQRAMAQLSENQRKILELRYRDGLDYRQIAAAMDLSDVAARKLCSRAIEALRERLASDNES